MRIDCPSCNASYEVPDAAMREGRVVRCTRCGGEWTPIAPVPIPEPAVKPPPAAQDVEPAPEPAAPRQMALADEPAVAAPMAAPAAPAPRVRKGSPLLAVAWALSVAAVLAAAAGLTVGRERVMTAWPPSTRAYSALGLAGHRGAAP